MQTKTIHILQKKNCAGEFVYAGSGDDRQWAIDEIIKQYKREPGVYRVVTRTETAIYVVGEPGEQITSEQLCQINKEKK